MAFESILSTKINDLSIAIDLLRYLAAMAVCVGHSISFFGVADAFRAPHMPYMQNIGVMVFFVLSGFLIAHVLASGASREDYSLWAFIADRIARIYSAFLPALVLIALIDGVLIYLNSFRFESYTGAKIFFLNLSMFQNYPGYFKNALAVPSYGAAGHLWTLAIEFHIYLFVGAAFFFFRVKNIIPAAILAGLTVCVPIANFSADKHGLPGAGLSILWLLGFASYYAVKMGIGRNTPMPALAAGLCLAVWMWLSNTKPGSEFSLECYATLSASFLLLIIITGKIRVLSKSHNFVVAVRFCANYSYSLYLVHYTLLFALKTFWSGNPEMGAVTGIFLSNIVAIPFAMATEFKHKKLAALLKKIPLSIASLIPKEKSPLKPLG
ncbi:MAG: acyltransferase [Exilibacterium sp.]